MQVRLVWQKPLVPPDRGKPRVLAISLVLHAVSFLALMYAPPLSLPTLPPPSPSEYQQGFAGKEDRIVWYKFRKLPDITPQSSRKARRPLRAAVKVDQAIISSPKNAPQRTQVVLAPVPEVAELPPLDLPNMIAVKLPPRQFTTPPDLVRPEVTKIAAPSDAPVPAVDQPEAAKLPADRLPSRPYVPPVTPPKARPVQAKIEAPSDAPELVERSKPSTGLPAIRLPSRPFVPPAPQKAPEPRKIAAATEVPAAPVNAPTSAAMPPVKLPARAFAPPAQQRQDPKSVAIPQMDAPAGDVTMAIAGLNPAVAAVKLPAASSPAQFSAGQTVRPTGATSDGEGKGITAPDLYAHAPEGGKNAKPDLLALTYAAPASKEFVDDMLRRSQLSAADPAKGTPSPRATGTATRVTNGPDRRFNGRDVYLMAIQTSNLTSYSGHWLMWYAARSADHPGLDPVSAPVPRRKVDPRYAPSAVDEHIEGRVQLFCVIGREGTVSSIELLRGADERLNRSAEEALAKWEFYPATRDGQPVDVDVVVEIPFVLARAPRSK